MHSGSARGGGSGGGCMGSGPAAGSGTCCGGGAGNAAGAPAMRQPSCGGGGGGGGAGGGGGGGGANAAPTLHAQLSMGSMGSSAAGMGGSGGGMASAAAAETRSTLEALLSPAEAHLLRLSEESKQLTNELVDLRFKHYGIDDKACKLRNEIVHLDVRIARAAADRQYLETHGSLPLPRPPAPERKEAFPAE